MSVLFNMLGLRSTRQSAAFVNHSRMFFATKGAGVPSQVFHDVNKNRYQES
jgi:hypothetical protein